MTRINEEASGSFQQPPEQLLRRALRADSAARRLRYAQKGLEHDEELSPDTYVLLLRQVYLAHFELQELKRACEVAREMAAVGPLEDIAHHDAARALWALGQTDEAIEAQRLASRAAPADRRSFHFWNLAVLQHQTGAPDGALASLERGLQWAGADRPLLHAHAAYIQLDQGRVPDALDETVATLNAAKCREGYGQFLLGMIAYHMGDIRRAAVHLRAFLNRNAALDPAKEASLREELRRARHALASIESA